jgi:transposase
MEAPFAERKTEPNSGLGKAIRYLLRHSEGADSVFAEGGSSIFP